MANNNNKLVNLPTIAAVSIAAVLGFDHIARGNKSILCGLIPGLCGPKKRRMPMGDPDAGLTQKQRIKKHFRNIAFVPDEPELKPLPPAERPFYKSSTHELRDMHWPIDIANALTY